MSFPNVQFHRTVWRNRSLFVQLCRRDITERYRSSAGGILWSLASPLFMLAIYTFVFSVIFKAQWGNRTVSKFDYAMLLFAGLLAYGIFSECATRAPTLIAAKPNFVKKVVFPLELIPMVAIANSLFHFVAGFMILLVFCLAAYGSLPATVFLAPVTLVPLLLFTLGVTWLLSSVGVFVHDLRHAMPLVATALMFLTPVFYPVDLVPEAMRATMRLNPLTIPVESLRAVAILGTSPDWRGLFISTLANGAFAALALLWFQRARRHFADVL